MSLGRGQAETVLQVLQEGFRNTAVVLVGTIDSTVDVPSIPACLKKTENACYCQFSTFYCFNCSHDKQTIQEEGEERVSPPSIV
jgi:hypothetical protein